MVECPFKMTPMPYSTVWCCAVGLIIQYSPPIHSILLSCIVKLHIITTGGQHHHSLPTHCLPVSQPKIDLSEQTFLSQQFESHLTDLIFKVQHFNRPYRLSVSLTAAQIS